MTGSEDHKTFNDRLARLRSRLDSRKDKGTGSQNPDRNMTALSRGLRFGTEFIAAIAVGTVLGLAVDQVFGSAPWGLLVLVVFGFAAGVLNIMRSAQELQAPDTGDEAPQTPDQDTPPDKSDQP